MTVTKLSIIQLNVKFTHLTGFQNTLDIGGGKERIWHEWMTYADPPWYIPDLEMVVDYVKRHMGPPPKGSGYSQNSLRFSNLIQRPEIFEELIGLARVDARIKPQTPRERVLELAGRPEPSKDTVKPVGDVLAGAKALEDFRKWRRENGL